MLRCRYMQAADRQSWADGIREGDSVSKKGWEGRRCDLRSCGHVRDESTLVGQEDVEMESLLGGSGLNDGEAPVSALSHKHIMD